MTDALTGIYNRLFFQKRLAYELQRRFFVRNSQGDIQKIRNLAIVVYRKDKTFKPLRDACHNQVSASLARERPARRFAV